MSQGHVEVDFENAKLWLRFVDYIEIIKEFICCERLGMWDGHLNAVTALLNLIAATGHIHYAKSARLYVQEMRKLPSTHPWLAAPEVCRRISLCEGVRDLLSLWAAGCGGIVDRHSDRASSGEVSEKPWWSYKKRGRGMTESVRQQWVYSMHACAAIHDAMTSLTGKHHTTSHQHC